jgi:hypothetical protein
LFVARYRCDPNVEPPRILAMGTQGPSGQWGDVDFKRGDVKKVRTNHQNHITKN